MSDDAPDDAADRRGGGRRLLVAACLTLPLALVYAAHFYWGLDTGRYGTGFLHYDAPSYWASARQYLNPGGSNGLAVANPYDFDPASPHVYFQAHVYGFGLLLRLADAPGFWNVALGLLLACAGFYVLQQIVDALVPAAGRRRLVLVVFAAWGGGVLALLGAAVSWWRGGPLDPFLFDVADGWWTLNLGRGFFIPTDGWLRLLVLLLLRDLLLERRRRALVWLWLLVASHPFTGLQFALLVPLWNVLEAVLGSPPRNAAWRRAATAALPLVAGTVYYLWFLPRFASHQRLAAELGQAWLMPLATTFAAYALVGALVLYRCRDAGGRAGLLAQPFQRLLLVVAGCSLVLANHELFMTPRQPIHFARGYVWLALCLLALPALDDLLRRLECPRRPARAAALSALLVLLLADNAVFVASLAARPYGAYLLETDRAVLGYLASRDDAPVVLCDYVGLCYWSATWTAARPYWGHNVNTTESDRKLAAMLGFFRQGVVPDELRDQAFLVISREGEADARLRTDPAYRVVFTAPRAVVYERAAPVP